MSPPFSAPIHPHDVAELVDFGIAGNDAYASMARLQERGVAALWNILCERPYAYLADEVGMGKTYQALGLAAVLWNHHPAARILFLSPRENLQRKWLEEVQRFFAGNYRRRQGLGDDLVSSVLFGDPIQQPELFSDLRAWVRALGTRGRLAAFLRHTSFMRPVYVQRLHERDLDEVWRRCRDDLVALGLHDVRRPRRLDPWTASLALNLAFAEATNRLLGRLGDGRPAFDLVVVDEAQCLRHSGNQTNQVLHALLRGQVARWLFMSATPAHGGPADLPAVLNHYPGCGEVVPESELTDLPALQRRLQGFLVRRQRRYVRGPAGELVGKASYRHHDAEGWAVRELGTLPTLAMGLVQKGLVDVLAGRSNRYRVGFLSSFESLQASLQRAPLPGCADEPDDGEPTDWHQDPNERKAEPEAPDTAFIGQLAQDFEGRFGLPLPHPKVDFVVERVAPAAFGDEHHPGGEKFLVFTRRVSTVETLRDRLDRRFHQAIESRVARSWGERLRWEGPDGAEAPPEVLDPDPEAAGDTQSSRPLRQAMAPGGWLYNYRLTFRGTGRNALFFEDDWIGMLCAAGGTSRQQAARALPDALWAESWTHCAHPAGAGRQAHHRAERLRYLAVHGALRAPGTFGLAGGLALRWAEVLGIVLHEHIHCAEADPDPHRDPDLFAEEPLWASWDRAFPSGRPLALPAAEAVDDEPPLFRRQVARTLLVHAFRLTDALVDLFYADRQARRTGRPLARVFLGWLADHPAAAGLRRECADWLAHLRLVVDGSLGRAGRSWSDLAREESWPQLYNPAAVVGITGGSGGNPTAVRQFRTPGHPRVIVCTDTLKEGVDLHLFCDRVLHYGVAWTAGDLEQRVGRVDRFFSRIERRLLRASEGETPVLEVGYPHVVASLERQQVERVIASQRQVEALMDSPLAGALSDGRELVVDQQVPDRPGRALEPFAEPAFPATGRAIVRVSAEHARRIRDHYRAWDALLRSGLRAAGWTVHPDRDEVVPRRTLVSPAGRSHDLGWPFDGGLERYVLTLSPCPWPDLDEHSGAWRRVVRKRSSVDESLLHALVPGPDDPEPALAAARVQAALAGREPAPRPLAQTPWAAAVRAAACQVEGSEGHKARFVVALGPRRHRLHLYAYDDVVRVVGVVSPLEGLARKNGWGSAPDPEAVRGWARQETASLSLGALDPHPRDGLCFGLRLVHGTLPEPAAARLLREIAARADAWEALVVGEDGE